MYNKRNAAGGTIATYHRWFEKTYEIRKSNEEYENKNNAIMAI
jgi:hypothetical protein